MRNFGIQVSVRDYIVSIIWFSNDWSSLSVSFLNDSVKLNPSLELSRTYVKICRLRHANQANDTEILVGYLFITVILISIKTKISTFFFMHFTMSQKCCEGRSEFSSEVFSESSQTSKIELLAKIVNV